MNKPEKNRSFVESLRDAARGVWDCVKMERNMRIHITFMSYVLYLAIALKLDRSEFAALFVTIVLVISLEMVNTAIEKLCDFNQKHFSSRIKIIKDISAGAVLVAALFSVCVGVAVFWRPGLWDLILRIVTTPIYILLLLCSMVVAFLFIYYGPYKL